MIDSKEISDFIERTLQGSEIFLVEVRVKPDNQIEVEIDSDAPVGIEECEKLTRAIESEFDRDKEDYTLEVGSSGLTSPFKIKRQYKKYLGKEVEAILKDGKKVIGILENVGENDFTILSKEKIKKPESKRPVLEEVPHTYGYDEVKQTKYLLRF